MTSGWDRNEIQDLRDLVQVRTGLILDTHHEEELSAILEEFRASEAELHHPSQATASLADRPVSHPWWQRVVRRLTVGETYFFRNQAHFEALREHVLPALIAARRASGLQQLRIWSAGCATGEEPYSLAILLRELIPDFEAWNITLLATDLNEVFLEEARRGLYRARSFRNETPEDIRARWFTPVDDGYQLHAAIRQMVQFKPLNLVSDVYPSYDSNTMHMDLIVCRNVTIYFEREITRQIVLRFHQALNDGGWLIVGHAEPQVEIYREFKVYNFKNTVFHRKETPALPAPPMVAVQPPEPAPKIALRQPRPAASLRQVARPVADAVPEEDFWRLAKQAADLAKWEEARRWLDKAETQGPFQARVHYLRGLIEIEELKREAAMASFRRAVYCDPQFVLALVALGDVCHSQGAQKEARRHWKRAQGVLSQLDLRLRLPFSDDLTGDMLSQLLDQRLAQHPGDK